MEAAVEYTCDAWCRVCYGYRRLHAGVPPGACEHCGLSERVLLRDPQARAEWVH